MSTVSVDVWVLGIFGVLVVVILVCCCCVCFQCKMFDLERQTNEFMMAGDVQQNTPNMANNDIASIEINDGNASTVAQSHGNIRISDNIIDSLMRRHAHNGWNGPINSTMTTTTTITTSITNGLNNDHNSNNETRVNRDLLETKMDAEPQHYDQEYQQFGANKKIGETKTWKTARGGNYKHVYIDETSNPNGFGFSSKDLAEIAQKSGNDFIEEERKEREASPSTLQVFTVKNALIVPLVSILPAKDKYKIRDDDIKNFKFAFEHILGYEMMPILKERLLTRDGLRAEVMKGVERFKSEVGKENEFDCFIVIFMGHGAMDFAEMQDQLCVLKSTEDGSLKDGKNKEFYYIKDLAKLLNDAGEVGKRLTEVPRLLINQACRGNQEILVNREWRKFDTLTSTQEEKEEKDPEPTVRVKDRLKEARKGIFNIINNINKGVYLSERQKISVSKESAFLYGAGLQRTVELTPASQKPIDALQYPGHPDQYLWETDRYFHCWQATAPGYITVDSFFSGAIANRLNRHFSKRNYDNEDDVPTRVMLSDLQNATSRMQQILAPIWDKNHPKYKEPEQFPRQQVSYLFGKTSDIEFVQKKEKATVNTFLLSKYACYEYKIDQDEDFKRKFFKPKENDSTQLSNSMKHLGFGAEKKMKNVLVCLLMIGKYSGDLQSNANLNVKTDYINAIKCFNGQFNYDILYSRKLSANELSQESDNAAVYTKTELIAGQSDEFSGDELNNIDFQDTWTLRDIRMFIEVKIKKTLICQDVYASVNQYDGLIIYVGGRGSRGHSMFASSIWSSFGEHYAVDNIRKSLITQQWFTEVQSCSKIVFLDLEWQSPDNLQSLNNYNGVNIKIQDTDQNFISVKGKDIGSRVTRYKRMEENYNYFEYCADHPPGEGRKENDNSSMMLGLLTENLSKRTLVDSRRTVPQVLAEFQNLCYQESKYTKNETSKTIMIGPNKNLPYTYLFRPNVVTSRFSADGQAIWCAGSPKELEKRRGVYLAAHAKNDKGDAIDKAASIAIEEDVD